ncbi:MIP/aquaporin family protein [Clostridium sp. C8-1-8]|uniref:MIP/aquaporin family protein n=1 Tax=Clostridium sp. C8-1-8 TaxID=2698831 RepID=UPI00136AE219|nr:MIP/aquaporin family protein [Clostridium sp. C8-1-8]
MYKKYVSEFIGTFFLLFIGTGAIMVNTINNNALGSVGISFAFGFIIFILIYLFGNTSGAHFNPAVTIALSFSGKFKSSEVIPYIISQVLGGTLASFVLKILLGNISSMGATIPANNIRNSSIIAVIVEFIFTFLLMYVIMRVSSSSKDDDFTGAFAIGLTIFIGALVAGPISGGSFNPARTIAPAIVSGNYTDLWVYIVAPIAGAIVGTTIYSATGNDESESETLVNNEIIYKTLDNEI